MFNAYNKIKELINKKQNILNITTGTEYETGRIIDGKKEYGKRIDLGTLPNATSKSVAHGISRATKILGYKAFANNANGVFGGVPLPHVSLNNYIELQITSTNVFISSSINASIFTGVIEIYYLKN